MGGYLSKKKLCANYVHFYFDDNIDIDDTNGVESWHGIQFNKCRNTHNWSKGKAKYQTTEAPKAVLATMSREFPRWCEIEFCLECNKVTPYDLSNISGEYKRDINDFEWLCRKCHMKKDDRFKRNKKKTKR